MSSKMLTATSLGLFLSATAIYAEAPRVVADIAPIHSLVARVMDGLGTPDLIGSIPRSKEDILKQAEREPVKLATEKVLVDGLFTRDEIDDLRTAARAEVEAAWDWADAQPYPEDGEEELMAHVFAPNAEDAA